MNKTKFTFAAAAIAAMAISLTACGGPKPTPIAEVAPNNKVEVITPRMELMDLANKEFSNHYYGVGEGTSNKEQMAASVAGVSARNELALMMQAEINSKAKASGINSINDEAVEGFMQRIIQESQQTLTDVRPQKTKVMYDTKEEKYTVYVLVSVPKDSANSVVKKQISNDKALTDALVTKALMDVIDSELK
jgi:predicted small lipoprotein YifL